MFYLSFENPIYQAVHHARLSISIDTHHRLLSIVERLEDEKLTFANLSNGAASSQPVSSLIKSSATAP